MYFSVWIRVARPDTPTGANRVPAHRSGVSVLDPFTGVNVDASIRPLRVGPLSDPSSEVQHKGWNARARRGVNVMAALILLALASPVMLLAALLIKLTSPGPVFFTQTRVGLDRRKDESGGPVDPRRRRDLGGRPFEILKFRSMTYQPPEERKQVWASPTDPRITPVGKYLRKFRIDELPQLLNVLKGDMNLVGPRPEQPAIFGELRETIDQYQARQRVLPGITGLAQVNLSYDQNLDSVREKVRLDLEYAQSECPIKDLRIMAKTVPVVLTGKGAL